MSIHEQLLEKWQKCREKRYPVLLIITAPLDPFFPPEQIEAIAGVIQAKVYNFKQKYQNRLNEFFTWQNVRDEIYQAANNDIVIVSELEPVYAKWPEDERVAFFKNLLRSEPEKGIILIINCQEDLSPIKEIEENSRGMIWVPLT
jgi:hypothetical protein